MSHDKTNERGSDHGGITISQYHSCSAVDGRGRDRELGRKQNGYGQMGKYQFRGEVEPESHRLEQPGWRRPADFALSSPGDSRRDPDSDVS